MNKIPNQITARSRFKRGTFAVFAAAMVAACLGLLPTSSSAQPNIVFLSLNEFAEPPDPAAVTWGLSRAPDAAYTDLLESSGATITRLLVLTGNPQTYPQETLDIINASDLVIVSRAVNSGGFQNDNATYWNEQITVPMMFMSGYITRNSRMGLMTASSLADTIGVVRLTANDPTHPIFNGIALDGGNLMVNPFGDVISINGTLMRGMSVATDTVASNGRLIASVGTDVNSEDETLVSAAVGAIMIAEWDAGESVTHAGGTQTTDTLASKRMVFYSGSREAGGVPIPAGAGGYDLFNDGEIMFYNTVNYLAGSNLVPPPRINDILPASGSLFVDASSSLTFNATSTADIPIEGIVVTVNGTDVSSSLTLGGTPTARTVSYTGFEENQAYLITIQVTNSVGSRTSNTSFDTFSEVGNIVIEAEDYNFEGGGFFDNIVLCHEFGGGADGCYFDRVSTPGVDALDTLGLTDDDANAADNTFRYGPDAVKTEEVDTFTTSDVVRSKFADLPPGNTGDIRDYDVYTLNTGDWQNYTRTIEEGTYVGFIRVSATTDQEIELGIVTSNAGQANQTVNTIGSFVIPGGGSYKTVPLTAAGGSTAQAFQAGGATPTTFRLTTINGGGNLRANYFFLAPFSQSEIPSAVAIQTPTDGSRYFVGDDVTVSAAATGPDGTAGSITQVEFFANDGTTSTSLGVDSSSPFEVTTSSLAIGSHTLTATATNSNSDTVDSAAVTIEIREQIVANLGTIAWVSFHSADDAPSANAAAAGFTEAPDAGYTQLLESKGYNVIRYLTSGTPDAAALNAADLVITSRSVPSGDYSGDAATAWNGITSPLIVMGGYPLRTSRMGFTTGTTMVDTAGTVALNVANPDHPIFSGIALDGGMTVNPFANIADFGGTTQRGVSINTDAINADGTLLASIGTATDPTVGGMAIGEWQAGSTMTHDGGAGTDILAGHRLVFLSGSREASGLTSEGSGIYDLEADGAKMFINAVEYMLHPEPYNVVFVSFHGADDAPSADAAAAGFTEAPDVEYTRLLANSGYNVTRLLNTGSPDPAVLNAADLVIISRSTPSPDFQNANASNWNSIEAPMLVLGGYVIRNSRMGFTTGGTMVDSTGTVSLTAAQPNHPIFLNIALDGDNTMVNPYANPVDFNGTTQLGISVNSDPLAADGRLIATISANGAPANGTIIAEWDAGVTMSNGTADTLAGPRVVFLTGTRENGITANAAGIYDLDADGAQLFLNAVRYTAGLGTPAGGGGGEIVFTDVTLNSDGTVTLTWTGGGTLQSTASLSTPDWQAVAGASSPQIVTVTGNAFFRVVP